MKWLRDSSILISIGLVLIEPKNVVVRVILLSWIAFGVILKFHNSDWIMQRNSELSITRPRFSEHKSLPRLTCWVCAVVAGVAVFGAITWPAREAKSPPQPFIPIPAPTPTPLTTPRPDQPKPNPKPKSRPQPEQPAPIQVLPAYGNLAARCDELGKEIIEGAERREQSMPNPRTNYEEYKNWYRQNDGIFFRATFYRYVVDIHKELLAVHVDDPRLDDLIERAQRNYDLRQNTNPQTVTEHPEAFHISINEIKEIGQRLRALATQIPK